MLLLHHTQDSKLSTESEFVEATDNIRFIELFAEYFGLVTSFDIKSTLIYQDGNSVIS
jgi:hypothetical protein